MVNGARFQESVGSENKLKDQAWKRERILIQRQVRILRIDEELYSAHSHVLKGASTNLSASFVENYYEEILPFQLNGKIVTFSTGLWRIKQLMSPILFLLAVMYQQMARVAIINLSIFDFLLKINNTFNVSFLFIKRQCT